MVFGCVDKVRVRGGRGKSVLYYFLKFGNAILYLGMLLPGIMSLAGWELLYCREKVHVRENLLMESSDQWR